MVSLTTDEDIHVTSLSNEAKYASPLAPEGFDFLITVSVLRGDLLFNLRQVTKAVTKIKN